MKSFIALRSVYSALFLAALFLGLQGCGGGGSSGNGGSTITHNGTTYGTVTSPYTGLVWLDRNLGASQICSVIDDVACYGDYYQWGRNSDGHEKGDSNIANEHAVQIDPVQQGAVGMFISVASASFDWTAPGVDDNGSLRSANWSKIDGTSVCPVGFRVPTIYELAAETIDEGANNRSVIFAGFLKLPSAGTRSMSGFLGQLDAGIVWSSTVDGEYSGDLAFTSSNAFIEGSGRLHGVPIRCIKN